MWLFLILLILMIGCCVEISKFSNGLTLLYYLQPVVYKTSRIIPCNMEKIIAKNFKDAKDNAVRVDCANKRIFIRWREIGKNAGMPILAAGVWPLSVTIKLFDLGDKTEAKILVKGSFTFTVVCLLMWIGGTYDIYRTSNQGLLEMALSELGFYIFLLVFFCWSYFIERALVRIYLDKLFREFSIKDS